MKKTFLFICLIAFGATYSFAQDKYGHLNFGNLISLMPETKAADASIEAFQKDLVTKGEKMAEDFRNKYAKLVSDDQAGIITPKQAQEQAAVLEKEQQSILAYEQEVVGKVQAKRQELLKPILEKAQAAIKAVAEENGFAMIFDSSVFNSILFAEDTEGVMPLVKAKLGIQ